jgi:hypothetical protein
VKPFIEPLSIIKYSVNYYTTKNMFSCPIYSGKAAELYSDGIHFDYTSGYLSQGQRFVVSFSLSRREICHGGLSYSYLIIINSTFLLAAYKLCRWNRKTGAHDV